MNTNSQPLNNKIIDINNMCDKIDLLDLGPPELEASIRTVAQAEEIVADISLATLSEAQDDLLFALKYSLKPDALYNSEDEAAHNHKIPRKRVKTFHEHPIPEPMDICESEFYSCCAGCVKTDGQIPLQYCRRAYPDRVIESYSDDSDEEREIDEYDPQRFFKDEEEGYDEENEMEIWILEQEAKRRYPRRSNTVDDKNDAHCGFRRSNTVDDEIEMELWILEQEAKRRFPRRSRSEGLQEPEEELIMPILEDEDEAEELLPPMPVLQRQNTQFTVNGVQVYNGNPNGSRFFDNSDEYWDVLSSIV